MTHLGDPEGVYPELELEAWQKADFIAPLALGRPASCLAKSSVCGKQTQVQLHFPGCPRSHLGSSEVLCGHHVEFLLNIGFLLLGQFA